MDEAQSIVPAERIARQKVMLDSDLAALCGVETGKLNRAGQVPRGLHIPVHYRRVRRVFEVPGWDSNMGWLTDATPHTPFTPRSTDARSYRAVPYYR